ncbi:hypothetical protein Fmac_021031 [Flemingia macrophylla]|uniref:Uncharacterized protein n=1 Tax=Flemingia macrophylla TaxID=520843 RepID=A0ABD1LVP2_9FABA
MNLSTVSLSCVTTPGGSANSSDIGLSKHHASKLQLPHFEPSVAEKLSDFTCGM